ncbi:hypothetical protein GQX74_004447 [Glossina fuscipes]|nr:hypothetical protein GQX74_004447 [Glossina fuscipes]
MNWNERNTIVGIVGGQLKSRLASKFPVEFRIFSHLTVLPQIRLGLQHILPLCCLENSVPYSIINRLFLVVYISEKCETMANLTDVRVYKLKLNSCVVKSNERQGMSPRCFDMVVGIKEGL